MIAIIDYGAGNLYNIRNAVEKLGVDTCVTDKIEAIREATGIILPGVGTAKVAMESIRAKKIEDVLEQRVKNEKVPFLGICLGMQLLFDYSEEGKVDCLGWIKGKVEKICTTSKVPQVGWNNISINKNSPILNGIHDEEDFYFIHSYCVQMCEKEVIVAYTEYGNRFVSVVQKDNIFGTQFHPEKSGEIGWKLLNNFYTVVNKYEKYL